MKRLNHQEIKKIELNILLYFDAFCKRNKLRYYLAGGTLLGAVRHQGFIPWDDDVDVCMPRKDYNRLIKIFDNNSRFVLLSNQLNNSYFPFAKLTDSTTIVKAQYNEQETGLWIDILPVDGLPEDLDKVNKIYEKCDFYRKILSLVDTKLGEGKTTYHKYAKYLLKPIANLYGGNRCSAVIEKIALSNPYDQSKYVGIVTWGLYGSGERMLKSEFEASTSVLFEGHQFPAFSCWQSYLTGLYGNFMQLPPEEKRITHDMMVYMKD
ncbi:phosphorylcholine transferase LicD [uncultured Mitsuokella sp.]|uniref:LicD family protein n=1 Tax=uncultured Mitsuokella sp. TaxID=453120 RepID=UPI00266FBCCB|nr:LicD family protein [uncultured Mitsuokella sp.]